jgi:hypothetical protein
VFIDRQESLYLNTLSSDVLEYHRQLLYDCCLAGENAELTQPLCRLLVAGGLGICWLLVDLWMATWSPGGKRARKRLLRVDAKMNQVCNCLLSKSNKQNGRCLGL